MDHAQVARTIADPRVAFVAFTGSVPGGQAVQKAAAARFIGTGLELGGKDPATSGGCRPRFAVENLVDGAYFNSGQSCCGIERIYVLKKIYKPFVGFPSSSPASTGSATRWRKKRTRPLVRTEAAENARADQAGGQERGGAPPAERHAEDPYPRPRS